MGSSTSACKYWMSDVIQSASLLISFTCIVFAIGVEIVYWITIMWLPGFSMLVNLDNRFTHALCSLETYTNSKNENLPIGFLTISKYFTRWDSNVRNYCDLARH